MKRSKGLLIASSGVVAVAVLLAMAYQPFRLTKATDTTTLADAVNFNSSFFDEAFTVDSPSSATDFCGNTAKANMQNLIDQNKISPFNAFALLGQSGLTGSHMVQGCALGFSGWDVLYGAKLSSLPHPFRIQKISDTEPDFVPFGFFMGVHGIRKIAFQGYSYVQQITPQGQKNLAICVADLDGTNKYNLSVADTAGMIDFETTNNVWKYTFTLPDTTETTGWTPRWIYVAGAFSSVTLNYVFSSATSEEDKKTYFNDLYSVEVWFDATC
jgi:hypothetical protein